MPLAGKRILVTGAGSGIGRSAARLFHDRGAELVLSTAWRPPFDSLAIQRFAPLFLLSTPFISPIHSLRAQE